MFRITYFSFKYEIGEVNNCYMKFKGEYERLSPSSIYDFNYFGGRCSLNAKYYLAKGEKL